MANPTVPQSGYRAGLKMITVWLDPEQKKALQIQAVNDQCTVAEIVRTAITAELTKRSG